jgi:hypothetical protein
MVKLRVRAIVPRRDPAARADERGFVGVRDCAFVNLATNPSIATYSAYSLCHQIVTTFSIANEVAVDHKLDIRRISKIAVLPSSKQILYCQCKIFEKPLLQTQALAEDTQVVSYIHYVRAIQARVWPLIYCLRMNGHDSFKAFCSTENKRQPSREPNAILPRSSLLWRSLCELYFSALSV